MKSHTRVRARTRARACTFIHLVSLNTISFQKQFTLTTNANDNIL